MNTHTPSETTGTAAALDTIVVDAPASAASDAAPQLTLPPTIGGPLPQQGSGQATGQYAQQQAGQYAHPGAPAAGQQPHASGQYAQPGTQPQPPHATPVYSEPQPQPGQHAYAFAIASFVLGIASIVAGWTFIAPIVGIVLGTIALRRNTSERTLALWGVWLNAAMLVFTGLAIVLGFGVATFGLFAGLFSGVWF